MSAPQEKPKAASGGGGGKDKDIEFATRIAEIGGASALMAPAAIKSIFASAPRALEALPSVAERIGSSLLKGLGAAFRALLRLLHLG